MTAMISPKRVHQLPPLDTNLALWTRLDTKTHITELDICPHGLSSKSCPNMSIPLNVSIHPATYPAHTQLPLPLNPPAHIDREISTRERGESGEVLSADTHHGDMSPSLRIVAALAVQAPTLTDDELFELDAEWGGAYLEARQRGYAEIASCARAVLRILGDESDRRAMGRAGRRAA